MKKIFTLLALSCITCNCLAQDSLMFRRISDEIMLHGTCYDNLRVLCKSVGNRLSGSPEAAKAVVWGQKIMNETGADKVWLQPADVPHWVRGKESLHLKYGEKGNYKDVTMLSLGNSEGTGGKVLEAQVVMVHTFDELNSLPKGQVEGKIVFFNYRFHQDLVNTSAGYGDAFKYRAFGAMVAAGKGAVGVILRSLSTAEDDVPHTGNMSHADSVKKIPAVAIGNISADTLEVKCAAGNVTAQIQSECRMLPETVRSYNVIGEITGSEHPERIIVVGGHLDSWDVGEGANDDGAGCVQSMEVLRAFKALGIKPKYTIRAVLFMNEENGVRGGITYADSAKAKNEEHVLAIETDEGGDSPRGIKLTMTDAQKEQILHFKNLFLPYGVYDFSQAEEDADIRPLTSSGIPSAGLLPDPQRYFDIHHSNNDTFERMSQRELKLGAVAMAQLIYVVSEHEFE